MDQVNSNFWLALKDKRVQEKGNKKVRRIEDWALIELWNHMLDKAVEELQLWQKNENCDSGWFMGAMDMTERVSELPQLHVVLTCSIGNRSLQIR